MITCYVYFKQYYNTLIEKQVQSVEQRRVLNDFLTRKLIIFPLGVVIVVILYACSFTIIHLAPAIENVKLIRRIADFATIMICAVLFYLDKLDLDKKLTKISIPTERTEDTV
jgi:hypothetical protein